MDDLLNLQDKVALITGAGSGIGMGSAMLFAKQGCRLILIDRTHEAMEQTVRQLSSTGAEIEVVPADVSDPTQVQNACDLGAFRFGRLDIVHANAGINGVWAPIEELTPEEFDHTIAVNLRGTFLTIKFSVPHLRSQGGGSILVTSSVNGTRIFSNTGATAYSTSKAGQVAMVKMLAVELGQYNIRVNAICPGAISTNIDQSTEQRNTDRIKIPVHYPRGSTPLTGHESGNIEQVGRLALFLVSDLADHITGEVVYIDAGSSLVVG